MKYSTLTRLLFLLKRDKVSTTLMLFWDTWASIKMLPKYRDSQ